MPITRPTLLLNEDIAKANIEQMAQKAQKSGTAFRPHFKTHFSATIGAWYSAYGVNSCTVSSVAMAEYFAANGWEDITIAFPFNRLELPVINDLAKNCKINLVLEDEETLNFVSQHIENTVNYFIKVDIGTNRTGLPVTTDFNSLIKTEGKLLFKGFLAHAGHSYGCRNNDEIRQVYKETTSKLQILKEKYHPFDPLISFGDTPTCSVVEDFSGIDEVRPGNFIFYDWMQYNISSCSFDNIAVCMATPIVAKHKTREEIIIHGGAVHFSKDFIEINGQRSYGQMVTLHENGWELMEQNCYLTRLSQEHGVLKVNDMSIWDSLHIGDVIGIIPIHSCLTANLMGSYITLGGTKIEQMPKC